MHLYQSFLLSLFMFNKILLCLYVIGLVIYLNECKMFDYFTMQLIYILTTSNRRVLHKQEYTSFRYTRISLITRDHPDTMVQANVSTLMYFFKIAFGVDKTCKTHYQFANQQAFVEIGYHVDAGLESLADHSLQWLYQQPSRMNSVVIA